MCEKHDIQKGLDELYEKIGKEVEKDEKAMSYLRFKEYLRDLSDNTDDA